MTRHAARPNDNEPDNWLGRVLAPWRALPGLQRDIARLLQIAATKSDINRLEQHMTSLEQQSRDDLTATITGALAAYDAVVAERDQYKAALETADADKAAAVAAAVQEANDANDAGDAAFNEQQVETLRRLQPAPASTPEPQPSDSPASDAETSDSA